MKKVYTEDKYLLDPHGAVGYLALKEYMKSAEGTGIFLETAHPCKFLDVVKEITTADIYPSGAKELLEKEKKSVKMKVDYGAFMEFLLSSE